MRKNYINIITLVIISFAVVQVKAQGLSIGSGTTFSLGSSILSLSGNWDNSGTFVTGSGTVIFNGASENQAITNSSGETFYNLTVNKSSDTLLLYNNIIINNALTMSAGFIGTGTDTVKLGDAASITETSGAEVIGNLTATRTLLQSVNNTFGGIGVEINAAGSVPGITKVTRVTGTAETGNGNSSIKRYYDISPAVDNNLNAAFIFYYNTTELNGLTEANLKLFESTDSGTDWTEEGGTENTTNHTVTLTGINSFSRWTLGSSTAPLPVELNTFTAKNINNKVELKWSTATEVNCYGFEVERSLSPTPSQREGASGLPLPSEGGRGVGWIKIGFVKGSGNSNSVKSYSFVDTNPLSDSSEYRLKQIDNNGNYQYSSVVKIKVVPAKFELYQNYPNPFNPTTTIKYDMPKQSKVVLKVYNILGEEVATLVNKEQQAGSYKVEFNSQQPTSNRQLASGVYVYRLQAGKYNSVKKFVLLK